jgi:hypothetical protein
VTLAGRLNPGWRRARWRLRLTIGKYRRFLDLAPEERTLCLRAAWRLPLVALQLRLFGVRPFQRACSGARDRPSTVLLPEEVTVRARRTGWCVAVAARYGLCRGNCLSRSLTLWWLLKEQGIESEVRVGVSGPSGRFEAHAWVECQGVVLNDRQDVDEVFAAFDQPLLSGRWPFRSEHLT